MLVDTLFAEVCITRAVAALVPPTNDMLGVTMRAGYSFMQGLAGLRDAYLF